jgi:hypothetical protein
MITTLRNIGIVYLGIGTICATGAALIEYINYKEGNTPKYEFKLRHGVVITLGWAYAPVIVTICASHALMLFIHKSRK